jgi:hypothetical protein
MLRQLRYIILTLLLLSGMVAGAQNRNNLIATKKGLVLLIDLNSPKTQIDTILMRAGVRGINVSAFIKGDFSKLLDDGWALTTRKYNIVEFSHKLKELKANPQENPFIITGDIIKGNKGPGYMDNAVYGINKFSTVSVYELPSGLTRFILPGYLKNRRVFLSGGFNDWSTLRGLMTKTSTGWAIDIKLKPGAWMYKFIADDGWLTDPNNLTNLDDGAGNTNSVYYKYNYIFKLHGYASAKRIALAGDFNGWKNDELFFEKQGDVWERSLYLKDGMHTYLFYVDGNAINDPANPDKYKDADGRLCSVLNVGDPITFKLGGHTDAHEVYLAGTFSKWQDGKIKMKKVDGGWAVSLILQPGNSDYKFIIDDDWITDPVNPTHDVEGGVLNSFIAVKPNHTFRLKGYNNAKTVIVSGTFNDWQESGYRMEKTDDGWAINVCLKPGKTRYKFLVDDNWILDPANKLWEQNEHNSGNSVLWIEP